MAGGLLALAPSASIDPLHSFFLGALSGKVAVVAGRPVKPKTPKIRVVQNWCEEFRSREHN